VRELKLADLQSRLNESSETANALLAVNRTFARSIEEIRASAARSRSLLLRLREKYQRLKSVNAELKTGIAATEAQKKNSVAQLEHRIAELQTEFDDTRVASDFEIGRLKLDNERLSKQSAALMDEKVNSGEAIGKLEVSEHQLKLQLSGLEAKLREEGSSSRTRAKSIEGLL
jgi:chromosome segregation ATPase